jgi:hypothetical protein
MITGNDIGQYFFIGMTHMGLAICIIDGRREVKIFHKARPSTRPSTEGKQSLLFKALFPFIGKTALQISIYREGNGKLPPNHTLAINDMLQI